MYLLDTDTLTWLHLGRSPVAQRARQVGEEQLATTIITVIEIMRGRYDALLKAADAEELLRAQQRLDVSAALLQDIPVIAVDEGAAAEFAKLLQHKKLKKIGRADLLIASIALAQRATLVTRNLKDFQLVPGLPIANWAD
ncbi:MAG: type II toxin-antitoxin system VapC family toxin [Gemmataceae bacterium]|nr:type II toxin-antitoxin system VapC family toxin [Gemmataceae bacterium]